MNLHTEPLIQAQPPHDHQTHARFLDERQVADLLNLSVRTIQNWRVRGGGPQYVRISRRCIRYRLADVLAWAEGRQEANMQIPIDAGQGFRFEAGRHSDLM